MLPRDLDRQPPRQAVAAAPEREAFVQPPDFGTNFEPPQLDKPTRLQTSRIATTSGQVDRNCHTPSNQA